MYRLSMRIVLAGGLLCAAANSAQAGCNSFSFISGGCFTGYDVQVPYPGGTDGANATTNGYLTARSNGGHSDPLVTLHADSSSGFINEITVTFRQILDSVPFALLLQGFTPAQSAQSTTGFQSFTFFAAVMNSFGSNSDLKFTVDGAGTPVFAELAFTVNAPAPVPGAGFLSFLAMAFGGVWRRLRKVAGLGAPAIASA